MRSRSPHTIRPSTPGRGAPHFPIAHVHAVCTAILLTALLLRTNLIDGSVATYPFSWKLPYYPPIWPITPSLIWPVAPSLIWPVAPSLIWPVDPSLIWPIVLFPICIPLIALLLAIHLIGSSAGMRYAPKLSWSISASIAKELLWTHG